LTQILFLIPLVLLLAFLYSSVGHGGASGYLAAMSLFALAPREMSTTALVLNLAVAGTATVAYWRAGHLSLMLPLQFLLTSVPAAFLGGMIHIPAIIYGLLLAATLTFAAVRLFLTGLDSSPQETRPVRTGVALFAGGGIGLLSGMVGVGGGIFLSPLMLLMRWADVKQTAAASAVFIVANSLSGLMGRTLAGNMAVGQLGFLVAPAFVGGLLGSQLGAWKLSGMTLRRLLGVVLLIAAAKLILAVR